MIRRQLAIKLRPLGVATATALIGLTAATIGLSPAETAAASEHGSTTIARLVAESTPVHAVVKLLDAP